MYSFCSRPEGGYRPPPKLQDVLGRCVAHGGSKVVELHQKIVLVLIDGTAGQIELKAALAERTAHGGREAGFLEKLAARSLEVRLAGL